MSENEGNVIGITQYPKFCPECGGMIIRKDERYENFMKGKNIDCGWCRKKYERHSYQRPYKKIITISETYLEREKSY